MGTEVMVPGTGELLDLTERTTTEIAEMVANFDTFTEEIKRFKRAASDVLAERLDHEGRRSAEVDGWKVAVSAPTKKAWDIARLRTTLDHLVTTDQISSEKASRCIRNKPEAVWAELKLLLSDPRVAPEISLCFTEEETPRYLTITEPKGNR